MSLSPFYLVHSLLFSGGVFFSAATLTLFSVFFSVLSFFVFVGFNPLCIRVCRRELPLQFFHLFLGYCVSEYVSLACSMFPIPGE